MNVLGQQGTPFLFVLDFTLQQPFVAPLASLDADVMFCMPTQTNAAMPHFDTTTLMSPCLTLNPIAYPCYQHAFDTVQAHMQAGNTYLLNLTFPTKIHLQPTYSLAHIFYHCRAPFKLLFKNQFVCFSPERFVQIKGNQIHTFPMKGTLDASLPNAVQRLLNDEKELAEHTMVVDLLRNDLAMVAKQVRVQRFRYLSQVQAGDKILLQTSSAICGELAPDWRAQVGDVLYQLLPAGSISGTPKHQTVHIIQTVETAPRGFFTGVFGIFDGYNIDSAVMIRFVERYGEQLVYRSGGGITVDSQATVEYQELLDKVYLPWG